MATVDIYGLLDPRDGSLRYIGKANCPQARLKSHLKRSMGMMLKKGQVSEANKDKLRYAARKAPHIFGCFVDV